MKYQPIRCTGRGIEACAACLRFTATPGPHQLLAHPEITAGRCLDFMAGRRAINPGRVINKIDFDETVVVCDWQEAFWRERRVRIAPCPRSMTATRYPHELIVADCVGDQLSRLYCTCGWVGPGAETEEAAVARHNAPHGLGLDPRSEWIVHEYLAGTGEEDDLPF